MPRVVTNKDSAMQYDRQMMATANPSMKFQGAMFNKPSDNRFRMFSETFHSFHFAHGNNNVQTIDGKTYHNL